MLLLTWLAGSFSPAGAQQAPNIDEATIGRVVQTLASDEMQGRDAYAPSGMRAAEFLAREFQAAGLQSPPGADGHLQRFSTRTLTVGTGRVVVNGRVLAPSQIAMRLGSGNIEWRTGDVPIVVVGPDDDPLTTVTSVANAGFDALVLIDEMHREGFTPLLQIFRRPVRVLSSAQGAAVVLALVTADQNATYQVTHTATIVEEPLANVVGILPGRRTDELVIFSAHYDHMRSTMLRGAHRNARCSSPPLRRRKPAGSARGITRASSIPTRSSRCSTSR
jgi:hypothetical protein